MANQQLVGYIKSQLAAGVTKADLLKAIETAGWSEFDTTDAFNVVEGKTPMTPAAPATPKPAAPAQPVTQPVVQPTAPAQPVQQPAQPMAQPQPAAPIQPQPVMQQPAVSGTPVNLGGPMRASTMQMNVRREGPASRTALWAALIVAAFIVAILGAAYFFMPQIQEILGFYFGGQSQTSTTTVEQTPVVPPVQEPVATTTATTTPTVPVATSTSQVSTSTTTKVKSGKGTVASTTASTTLGH